MDRFSYARYRANPSYADRSAFIWRPMVSFSVRGLEGRFDTKGLADTGAVETLLPMAIWGEVGPAHVPGEVGELTAANGAAFPVTYATVDLGIKLGRHRYWWSALVGFTDARDEAVLGDAGFMRYFDLRFHRPERYLTVRRATTLPLSIMPRR
jgi:hypothetical protein